MKLRRSFLALFLVLANGYTLAHADESARSCQALLERIPSRLAARLTQNESEAISAQSVSMRPMSSLARAIPMSRVWRELEQSARRLIDTTPDDPQKGYIVFEALGKEIPTALREVGRLREKTFRTVGEGTGLAVDIDRFDPDYVQLICWDKRSGTISGAYRLGQIDRILPERGFAGLYSATLFNFKNLVNKEFEAHALEVGRSFVRPEYQRGLTLGVMWAGIAKYLAENPRYKYLMGPVSISGDFNDRSKLILSRYLMDRFPHPKAKQVKAYTPPRLLTTLKESEIRSLLNHLHSLQDLQGIIQISEGDTSMRLPPLIKIYLELNVRFLAFNWDSSFNTLDGLIWTDISELPLQTQAKYMGESAAVAYRQYHGK